MSEEIHDDPARYGNTGPDAKDVTRPRTAAREVSSDPVPIDRYSGSNSVTNVLAALDGLSDGPSLDGYEGRTESDGRPAPERI